MPQNDGRPQTGPHAEGALPPLVPPAVRAWARGARGVLAQLVPPALMLGAGAGMLGWTAATALGALLPARGIRPMEVAVGLGRWTLVAGLALCVVAQGLHQARLRWRAPIRFR